MPLLEAHCLITFPSVPSQLIEFLQATPTPMVYDNEMIEIKEMIYGRKK